MGKWESRRVAGGSRSRMIATALGLTVTAGGLLVSAPVSAQITNTKHNLGTTAGGTGVNKFSATAEICVFCHTPHGADTSAAVPLWNRTITGTTYQTYDSLGTSTLEGKTAPVGSVSIACLSCHDGTQAMNTVINAPGSGLTNTTWSAGTWSGANQVGGKIAPGLVTNLGTDLKNDHPIGIQYAGGGYKLSTPTTRPANTGDPDFRAPQSTVLGSTQVWWVDTTATGGVAGSRQKTDMLLYSRAPGASSGYTGQLELEPFVECASCHDPHTTNSTFLRISNAGSAVCLACHIK